MSDIWNRARQLRAHLIASSQAHHTTIDGALYADTGFLNAVRIPGVTMEHMGFGEFYADTPKGRVDFDRMRGKDFPEASGRSHKVYGPGAGWLVDQMEKKNLSTRVASAKVAEPGAVNPFDVVEGVAQVVFDLAKRLPGASVSFSPNRVLVPRGASKPYGSFTISYYEGRSPVGYGLLDVDIKLFDLERGDCSVEVTSLVTKHNLLSVVANAQNAQRMVGSDLARLWKSEMKSGLVNHAKSAKQITRLWFVEDPTPDTEIIDIAWSADVGPQLVQIIIGGGIRMRDKNLAAFDSEADARKEAMARLKKLWGDEIPEWVLVNQKQKL